MAAPTLLILAAGLGSRHRGNKLNDPVGPGGETIMDYSIYDARRAGFGRILFVIRQAIELEFRGAISARYGKHLAPEYVYQEVAKLPAGFRTPPGRVQPWGTAQAVLMAAQTIHEPFAVINGDDFYGADSYRAMAHHLESGTADYATMGFVLRNTLPEFGPVARAVCEPAEDRCLKRLTELKNIEREGGHALQTDAEGNVGRLTGDEIVSMNMWGFTPKVFAQIEERFAGFLKRTGNNLTAEYALPEAIGELVEANAARVRVLQCADRWFGVTHGHDQSGAVESIRHLVTAGYYPRKLW
ncbi:MAG: sugar phosphate nucleotidyltransferase [Terracidiphilus sp.]|nr:sugar phosphate nucleotidyltransferase [Terracidiphilus sp.]